MIALAVGVLLVPLLDQACKLAVLRGLASASVSLNPLGRLAVVRSQVWLTRPGSRSNLRVIWCLWLIAGGSLALVSGLFPSCGWFAGALLGGSLSHVLETSLRGCVIDYICPSFWPAFNLADVAITVGALGILAAIATKGVWL